MSRLSLAALALLFLSGSAYTNEHNITITDEKWCGVEQDTCALNDDDGPWMSLLQQWALTAPENGRQGRIMALPPAQGYYVSDRIDGPMLSPPPPPHAAHSQAPRPAAARPYDEWQHTPPPPPTNGKIVNRPPNPYKDKFKPSYPAPPQNQPIPVHGAGAGVDRVDESRPSPQKTVSETDLYLLGAIEKLVYRADLMEKRVRKMEETVHYLVAGVHNKPEPCAENFTRVGEGCYHVSAEPANWKGASYACRRLHANMLEINSDHELKKLTSAFLADKRLRDGEFWTGGLNPGLLWIWSHSATPVLSNSTSAEGAGGAAQAQVAGGGRCLAWRAGPAGAAGAAGAGGGAGAGGASYRGHDCALRHRYICEKGEDKQKLSNEIERVARNMKRGRIPKIIWTDEP